MKRYISLILIISTVLCACFSLASCKGSAEYSKGLSFELNESGDAYTVVSIGKCKDTNIVIPEKYNDIPVTAIGEYAFRGSAITAITITENIVSIAENAFDSCKSLSYNKYETVSYIGTAKNPYYALVLASENSKESFKIHNDTKIIADSAFFDCSIKELSLPSGLTHIGYGVFMSCGALEKITLPKTLTHIGSEAFANCSSLKSVELPGNLQYIGDSVFMYCMKLKSISFLGTSEEWSAVSSDGWNRYFDEDVTIEFKGA